jgi:hypothetical protein
LTVDGADLHWLRRGGAVAAALSGAAGAKIILKSSDSYLTVLDGDGNETQLKNNAVYKQFTDYWGTPGYPRGEDISEGYGVRLTGPAVFDWDSTGGGRWVKQ